MSSTPTFEKILRVEGMMCGNCTAKVEKALSAVDGVHTVSVDLDSKLAKVSGTASAAALLEAVTAAGKEAHLVLPAAPTVTVLRVEGMMCGNCTAKVEKALSAVDGVDTVSVDLDSKMAKVSGTASAAALVEAVTAAGKEAQLLEEPKMPIPRRTKSTPLSRDSDGTKHPAAFMVTAGTAPARGSGGVEPTPPEVSSRPSSTSLSTSVFNALGMGGDSEETCVLSIEGMTCASCVLAVERALFSVPGVVTVSVSLMGKRGQVCYKPSEVAPEDLCNAVQQMGFRSAQMAEADLMGGNDAEETQQWRAQLLGSLVFSLPTFVIAMILPETPLRDALHTTVVPGLSVGVLVLWLLSTPVQFVFGMQFYKRAFKAVSHGNANMDVLVALSTTVAYFYSAFFTGLRMLHCQGIYLFRRHNHQLLLLHACADGDDCQLEDSSLHSCTDIAILDVCFEVSTMLISFMLLGKYLEASAKGKASEAVMKLMALQPPSAMLCVDWPVSKEPPKEVLVAELRSGDVLQVLPGSVVPADGVVVRGESAVDESMLTGEAVPVSKQVEDSVVGGSYNGPGPLWISVTAVGANSALSKIMSLVAAAQMRKPQVQAFADRASAIFVPCTVSLALLTWLIWYLCVYAGGLSPQLVAASGLPSGQVLAFSFGVAVLVIACPCALGLATPTAVMVGSGVGAKHGVLFKGGDVIENASRVTALIFDKTGTITSGALTVAAVVSWDAELSSDELLWFVASAEQYSEHPIGRAIAMHATEMGLELGAARALRSITSRGVSCEISRRPLLLGNRAWMTQHGVVIGAEQEEQIAAHEATGKTVVIVSLDHTLSGIVAMGDSVKREAAAVVKQLGLWGIEVWMVSGDNERTVRHVAHSVGIERFVGGVTPEGKKTKLAQLQAEGHVVAMVGDGINDAPALAQAQVGIAVGSGTEVAIETADVVLMKSALRDVCITLELSRTVMRRIRLNFAWATGYNLIGIPLAMGVLFPVWHARMPPMFAGLAMALSSVSVVVSSLFLNGYRPSELPQPEADVDVIVKY